MSRMRRVALGLGSSLGDRRARLELTVRQLDAQPGVHVVRVSRLYRTPPMRGGTARGWFLNGVALLDVALQPEQLLARCRALEERAGRRRARFWGDRTLDLDLLLFEGWISDQAELLLPHPAIGQRRFVLTPLLEVWPDAIDQRTGRLYRETGAPTGPGLVPVGVVARRPAVMYTSGPEGAGGPHEAVHRHRKPRPHSRSGQLGNPGWLHHEPVAHRP